MMISVSFIDMARHRFVSYEGLNLDGELNINKGLVDLLKPC